jgi:hypothetical protein
MVTRHRDDEHDLSRILRAIITRLDALEHRCTDMERLFVWSGADKKVVLKHDGEEPAR